MKVRQLTRLDRSSVYTIEPDRTVLEAVRKLVQHNIGALPVCDGSCVKLFGIITERDILRLCAMQPLQDMQTLKVSDVMTHEVIFGSPEDDIEKVMRTMTQNRIRHLPILEDGKFVDIISIGDVVKAELERSSQEAEYLREYVSG